MAPPLKKKGPLWGFHEPTVTAGAGVEQAAQSTGQAMQDPRFGMASGLGAAAGVVRGAGKFGQMMNPKTRAAMEGGFNVPTSQMRRDIPLIAPPPLSKMEVPYGEVAQRDSYLADVIARNKDATNAEQHSGQLGFGRTYGANSLELRRRTLQGQRDLRDEVASQADPRSGGGVPYRPNVRK